jgi:hypothetical protein
MRNMPRAPSASVCWGRCSHACFCKSGQSRPYALCLAPPAGPDGQLPGRHAGGARAAWHMATCRAHTRPCHRHATWSATEVAPHASHQRCNALLKLLCAISTEHPSPLSLSAPRRPPACRQDRYGRMAAAAQSFIIVQFGLSCFRRRAAPPGSPQPQPPAYSAATFNFYLFPRPPEGVRMTERDSLAPAEYWD